MAQSYSITDLERLTGIKAHTIRIWERRYGLLNPERTDTNIRSYSDEDLRKILNVNTLIREGWKISHISELTQQDLEAQVWSCAKTSKTEANIYHIYAEAMISAALSFDEDWFDSVYSEVTGRFGLSLTMTHVVGPMMNRIGLMWSVMKMHPGQEHFASNLVRRKLFTAIDSISSKGSKGKFLLFLPPWEEHEIGLIYAWYLLRSSGYHVVYLGQRVPEEALLESINIVRPNTLMTFFVTHESEAIIRRFYDSIVKDIGRIELYAGVRQDMLSGIPDGIKVLDSPQALLDII